MVLDVADIADGIGHRPLEPTMETPAPGPSDEGTAPPDRWKAQRVFRERQRVRASSDPLFPIASLVSILIMPVVISKATQLFVTDVQHMQLMPCTAVVVGKPINELLVSSVLNPGL